MPAVTNKGQVWYFDFILSLIIFFAASMILFQYVFNQKQASPVLSQELAIDAITASSLLVSDGIPTNWTLASVEIPGILSGHYNVSMDKWNALEGIASVSPTQFKSLLRTRFSPRILLQELNGSVAASIGASPSNEKHLVQVTRIVIRNESIMRLQVILWS